MAPQWRGLVRTGDCFGWHITRLINCDPERVSHCGVSTSTTVKRVNVVVGKTKSRYEAAFSRNHWLSKVGCRKVFLKNYRNHVQHF